MMKRFLCALAFTALAMPALAADVGVSVTVGQPGFYGHIEIGDAPRPAVIYPQPVVIQPAPRGVVYQPIYLHVPPGHAKDWGKHCGKYNACGRPVYFVKESWYNDVYVPHYQKQHGGPKGRHGAGKHDKGHGKGRG